MERGGRRMKERERGKRKRGRERGGGRVRG